MLNILLKYLTILVIILFTFIINNENFIITKTNTNCQRKWFDHLDSFVCVCNKTNCDSFNYNDNISNETKKITIFSSDKHYDRFKRNEFNFGNDHQPFNEGQFVIINRNKTYQKIIGFGAAFTDSTGINIKNLDDKLSKNIIYDYFGSSGLRYSMGRIPIAGSDFSTRPYTYDEFHDDFDLKYFNLTLDDFNYKFPLIKLAKNISHYPIKLFASPWSPPSWLKTNNHLNGLGRIKGKPDEIYYKTYALYLTKFLQHYQKYGINFWAMTLQNEPFDGSIPAFKFNCNAMSPEEQRDFIKKTLAPLLSDAGFGIDKLKLIIMDDQRPFMEKWANIVLGDQQASKFVSGIGFHWYLNEFTTPEILTTIHKKFPNYFLLSTEACEGSWPYRSISVSLGNWERAETYAYDIIQDLNHYTNGWIDWNMALDLEGGPNWSKNFVDAPIIVNADKNEYYKQPMYYSLAHFTRFLEPGSIRLDLITHHNYLNMVAFLTPNNATILIVLNRNVRNVPLKIQDDKNGIFIHEIKGKTIETLIWY